MSRFAQEAAWVSEVVQLGTWVSLVRDAELLASALRVVAW